MKALEERIRKDGRVLPGNILKVSDFLNHQIDVPFMLEMGREIAGLFAGEKPTKVLTIEASGIAVGFAAFRQGQAGWEGKTLFLCTSAAELDFCRRISKKLYRCGKMCYTDNCNGPLPCIK